MNFRCIHAANLAVSHLSPTALEIAVHGTPPCILPSVRGYFPLRQRRKFSQREWLHARGLREKEALMPSGLHEGLIRAAAARFPGMRINGFAREVRAAMMAAMDDPEAAAWLKEAVPTFRRPDAHVINAAARIVTAIEVDVSGPLNDDKLRDYVQTWFDMEAEGWLLRLVCVDRYGRDAEIDLCSWWYQFNCKDGASPDMVDKMQMAMGHLRAPAFDASARFADEHVTELASQSAETMATATEPDVG